MKLAARLDRILAAPGLIPSLSATSLNENPNRWCSRNAWRPLAGTCPGADSTRRRSCRRSVAVDAVDVSDSMTAAADDSSSYRARLARLRRYIRKTRFAIANTHGF